MQVAWDKKDPQNKQMLDPERQTEEGEVEEGSDKRNDGHQREIQQLCGEFEQEVERTGQN